MIVNKRKAVDVGQQPDPVVPRLTGQHIDYISPHFFALAAMALYLQSTTLSPFPSTFQRGGSSAFLRCRPLPQP